MTPRDEQEIYFGRIFRTRHNFSPVLATRPADWSGTILGATLRLAGNTNQKTFRHHRQVDFGIDNLFTKVKRRDRKKTKVVCLKVSWIFDQMKTGENYTKAGVLAGKLKQFGANTINTIGAHNSERVLWTLSVILCGMLSHLPGTHA